MYGTSSIVYSINKYGKLKLPDGPKFMEPVVGIYISALSIAINVVLWKWNRVVEDKID